MIQNKVCAYVSATFRESVGVREMARQGVIGVEEIIRKKVAEIRKWKLTSLGKQNPKWGFKFTVMTYNILSQTAVDNHMYLYRCCNPSFLNEDYRISRILPEILRSKSDIICLQEVEQNLFEQCIQKILHSKGFESIFKKRSGGKSDGCAILWRTAKFDLLKHQEVDFRKQNSKLLNRDNVGLIAVLKPLHPCAGQTQLHVATTHLLFNPKRGEIKLCQLRLFLAELEKSALKRVTDMGRIYHPTILCGDFNFQPHSPLYNFVETGRLDVADLITGNMSGQHESMGKGRPMSGIDLSLDRVGVDQAGRVCSNKVSSGTNGSPRSKDEDEMDDVNVDNPHWAAAVRALQGMRKNKIKADVLAAEDAPSEESSSQIFYHDFNFVPVYKYTQHDKRSIPVTSMTGDEFNTVDHIFYSVKEKNLASYKEGPLRLLGSCKLPYAEDLKDLGGLPNAYLGSDHVCLISKFVINFRR